MADFGALRWPHFSSRPLAASTAVPGSNWTMRIGSETKKPANGGL